MLIGINAPEVLTGEASSTGASLAFVDQATDAAYAVQEISRPVSTTSQLDVLQLEPFHAGDTLYVYAVSTNGGSLSRVMLQDSVGKSILTAFASADPGTIAFQYTFPKDAAGYQLIVLPQLDAASIMDRYRLLIGRNAPEVLTGAAVPTIHHMIKEPTQVSIWLVIDQVSDVDQQGENYTVVGSLYFRWRDPLRAFRPDVCGCAVQTFIGDDFNEFTHPGAGISWPEFEISNEQGQRETQLRGAAVASDGTVTYTERFTVTLQAPDFDFRMFPLNHYSAMSARLKRS